MKKFLTVVRAGLVLYALSMAGQAGLVDDN